jgi:outer membrane protein TolC
MLAACSVGTPYRKPEIPLPTAWDAAHAGNSDLESAQSVWPGADWWHRFGSPQLDDLIDQARRANDDLEAAMARVQEADAQLRIAGAPLLPTVDLGAAATRERTEISGKGMGVYNVFSPVLTASYELDFWGKNRAARDAARALAVASLYDRQTVALTVISSVATTYLQALELRERIDVARLNLENGRKISHSSSKSARRPASMWPSRKRP